MAGKVTVIDNDRGYTAIVADLLNMHTTEFVVGIRDGSDVDPVRKKRRTTKRGKGEELTPAQKGVIHEYGAPSAHIPERSFLRSTFDEGRQKHTMRIHTALIRAVQRMVFAQRNRPALPFRVNTPYADDKARKASVMSGRANEIQKALDTAMEDEAAVMVGEVKRKIIVGPFKRNAPMTIAKKGRNEPLIDEGEMLDAIDYKMIKHRRG